MNHFRTRHPDYEKQAPVRRRASKQDDDSADDTSMDDFAAEARKRREELYHASQVRARARRKGKSS